MLFGSELALLPDLKLGVAVLANGAQSNHLARKLAAAILFLAASSKHGYEGHRSVITDDEPRMGRDGPLTGRYASNLGLLVIDSDTDSLCACIIEQILDLVRFDDGSYQLTSESSQRLPDSYRILGQLRLRTKQLGDRFVTTISS